MKLIPQILTIIYSILLSASLFAQTNKAVENYFLDGIEHYNVENTEEAIKYFKKAISIDSENDAAYYYLGLSYSRLSDVKSTEIYLKKAIEKDPSNYWYRITLAEFYAQTHQIEVAISLYEGLTNDFPKKSSLYYQIIDLYISDKQIDNAVKTLDKIEEIRGVNEATGNTRYELLRMAGKYEEAELILTKINSDYPSARTAYMMGDVYKNKFDDTTALKYYKQSIEIDPSYSPSYFGLAEIYRVKRQFNYFFENINIFLASPDVMPAMKAGYMNEVILNPQFVQTFLPQVDNMVTTIVQTHPNDTSALYLAGSYNIQTGRQDEGIAIYKAITELYPTDFRAIMEYISLLYYMEKWDELSITAESALKIFPDDPSLIEICGSAYWRQGKVDIAIEAYEKLIKNSKGNSRILLSAYSALGDLYHTKNINAKAYSFYKKALSIDPEYAPILNNYAYFLSLEKKQLKKALAMSKKTIKKEPDNPTYLDTYAWILHLLGENDDAKGYLKHAILYGGKNSSAILDHYAEVLYALGEYDLSFIYWEQADKLEPESGFKEKIEAKRNKLKNK